MASIKKTLENSPSFLYSFKWKWTRFVQIFLRIRVAFFKSKTSKLSKFWWQFNCWSPWIPVLLPEGWIVVVEERLKSSIVASDERFSRHRHATNFQATVPIKYPMIRVVIRANASSFWRIARTIEHLKILHNIMAIVMNHKCIGNKISVIIK